MKAFEKFSEEIINGVGGFKQMECDKKMKGDRDVQIAIWTLSCLSNYNNPAARNILKLIIDDRVKSYEVLV